MGKRTLVRGLAAGAAGTAAMAAYRKLVLRRSRDGVLTWDQAPPQARAVRRALGTVGVELSPRRIPFVASLVDWTYGTALGPAYAVLDEQADANAVAEGAGFGAGAWALSMPRVRSIGAIASGLSQHLVYGLAVAGAYEALERRDRREQRRRILGAALAAGGAVGTIVRRRKKDRVPSFVRAPAQKVGRAVPVG